MTPRSSLGFDDRLWVPLPSLRTQLDKNRKHVLAILKASNAPAQSFVSNECLKISTDVEIREIILF